MQIPQGQAHFFISLVAVSFSGKNMLLLVIKVTSVYKKRNSFKLPACA
jgi:hypothetical protein